MNITEERGTIPACPQCGATAPRIAWIGWTGTGNPDVSQPAAAWKCKACDQKWKRPIATLSACPGTPPTRDSASLPMRSANAPTRRSARQG